MSRTDDEPRRPARGGIASASFRGVHAQGRAQTNMGKRAKKRRSQSVLKTNAYYSRFQVKFARRRAGTWRSSPRCGAREPARTTRSSDPDADVDDSETVLPREMRWRKSSRSSARRRARSFGRIDRHRHADVGHGRVFSPLPPHRSGGRVLALSSRATPCASVWTDRNTRHSFRRASQVKRTTMPVNA